MSGSNAAGLHEQKAKRRNSVALAALVSLFAQGAFGADLDKRIEFNIPAQDLSAALIQFSQQARLQVIIREDLTGQMSPSISGALPIKQALIRLLDPAGLNYQVVGDTSITVGKVAEKTTAVPKGVLRLAQAEGTAAPQYSSAPQPTQSTPSQASEGMAIAEVTVTGSRLAQAQDSPLPVTAISIEDFQQGAQATPADFLQKFSFALSADGRGTWGFGGEGEAAIGMRGLEAKNTLFLVNGFRIAQDGVNGASNMNAIPAAAIERVEVLTGGASAIYGTDAVAGVINYILKKDFEGIAFDSFYGDSSRGGRETVSASFLAGTPIADGKGNVMLGASYLDQKGITSMQRLDLFNGPRNINGVRVPGSFTFPAGYFGTGSAQGRYTIRDGVTQPTAASDFRLRNSATDTWNTATNQGFFVTFPLRQTSLFGSLEYEVLEDWLTFFSDFTYTKTDTSDRFYAQALTVSNGARSVATINDGPPRVFNLRIPANNYYNRQLFGTNAVDILNWDLRFAELGYTERTLKRDEYRVVAGLRGRIGSDYDWQIAFNRSEFNRDESQANQINLAALERALARTGPDAFNPFGPNSEAVLDELRVTLPFDENAYEQSVIASVRGPLVELPAGRMTGALGAEKRRSYVDRPLGQATFDFRGSFPYDFLYDITGYFAEVNVPLLASLTLDLAARAEDYEDMFDTTVGSVSLRWRPVDSVLLRGSYSQGFVAPGVTDLASNGFTTPQQTFLDPRTGQSFALDIFSVGNSQLKPEDSDIYNFDVTFTPDSVPGLTASTGYFRIEQQDIVRDLAVQYIIDRYFATGGPGNAGAEFADRIEFDSAANRILQVTRGPFNLAERTVDGIDFSVQYRLPEFDIGTFSVGLNGSRYLTFEEVDLPGADPVSYLGKVRDFIAVYPKLKATANVQWSLDRWSAYVGANGFSSVQNTGSTVKRRLGAFISTDLSLSYQFDRVGITTAVDNVFGRKPPMDTSIYGNYPLNSYDPTGPYYSVRMSTKF